MGWCTGGSVLGESWEEIRKYVPKKKRVKLFKELIDIFEGYDMDCYEGIEEFKEGRKALRKLHPEWYEDEE